jgi:hypothetical protein
VWCAVRENLIGATDSAPFILLQNRSQRSRPRPDLWATSWAGSGLGRIPESAQHCSSVFKFLILFSLQFKFRLNLNLNLVSIPASLCNPVKTSII